MKPAFINYNLIVSNDINEHDDKEIIYNDLDVQKRLTLSTKHSLKSAKVDIHQNQNFVRRSSYSS